MDDALARQPGSADFQAMSRYRLARLQKALQVRGVAAAILYDPINIRYATGSRNMLVWCLHNPVRYCVVPAEGRPVLFEFRGSEHLAKALAIDLEVRPAIAWSYFIAGSKVGERARLWSAEIDDLLEGWCGAGPQRVAVDRLDPAGTFALAELGHQIVDAQEAMEEARSVKSGDEILCIREAIAVADLALSRMKEALRPGISENALWSLLHQTNSAQGGEYIETRLLNSGERTNPWLQECSDRVIADGDIVCIDTDMVGPHGYCVDISRSLFCGAGRPTADQREAYRLAVEQVGYNTALIRPGLAYEDLSRQAWTIPPRFYAQHYASVAHGIGMTYENPRVVYPEDWAAGGCEGEFRENMTVCVESYIGEVGGAFGIKFTEQVLVTASGCEILSRFGHEEALLA